MSARESIKGYLYQTLIALLQMLDDDTWSTVAIEPKELDEKVDIYWEGTQTTAMQVKSSKSRINKMEAQRYVADLTSNYPNANKYELVLCAHVVMELKNGDSLDGATLRINNSQPIDLTQQAAQRLDTFLHRHSISQTPPLIRELLTRALISCLIDFSTEGTSISRTEFEEQIKSWVLICYPDAARNSRFSMCEVANGPCHMMLRKTIDSNTGKPNDYEELQFISDLHFVNASKAPSIIQFVMFSLTVDGVRHFFIPRFFFDPTKVDNTLSPERRADHQNGIEIFQPICIVPKGVEHRKLVASSLRSEVSSKFLSDNRNSEFLIEVFVKYHHLDFYFLAHTFNPNILFDELFARKDSIAYYQPDIEQDEEALRQSVARMA
jgi:hypothetical protein